MKNIILLLITLFSVSSYSMTANKFSTNFLSLMVVGDLNIAYERMLEPNFSWVTTIHSYNINESNSQTSDYGYDSTNDSYSMFRLSTGVRTYKPDVIDKYKAQFLEFKLGSLSSNAGTNFFLEFYQGEQVNFSNKVFYDYKWGIARNLSESGFQLYLTLGANIGFYF